MYERVTVGIGINPEKRPLFSCDERLELLRAVLGPYKNVDVATFDGLAVDFVRRCNAALMLRGLRTLSDIETEFTTCLANRVLAPDIETVFLMAGEKYAHISSTLIKQIAQMGHQNNAEKLRALRSGTVYQAAHRQIQPAHAIARRSRSMRRGSFPWLKQHPRCGHLDSRRPISRCRTSTVRRSRSLISPASEDCW